MGHGRRPYMELRTYFGQVQKRCTKCGLWKSVEHEFYKRIPYKNGDVRPRAECKSCTNRLSGERKFSHAGDVHGFISMGLVKKDLQELVRRIGKAETARRIGVSGPHLWKIMGGKDGAQLNGHVRKVTAMAIWRELKKVRKANEWRSRKDIHHNSKLRRRRARG